MPRNILFLSHRLPYPPNKGDKIRSCALLKHLASQGTVHLGCFVDDPADFAHLDAVRQLARGSTHFEPIGRAAKLARAAHALVSGKAITVANYASDRLEKHITHLFRENRFDDVVVFGSAMAPYLFKPEFESHRVLFDMVDVDSDKWQQYSDASSGFLKWLYRREAVTLEEMERQAARLFGRTLLVSEFEAETFRGIAPESADKIRALTNGVDLGYFSPGAFENPFPQAECPIVMTGHMDYRPNYEGALWFAREILPLVKKSLPNVRAYFVGASPPPALQAAAGADVVVTGRVADVRPYLQFANAVVAPLRIARGVQNKVLEAMAMARPVVATREATRALNVEPGTHLWVANDPQQFANAVLSALASGDGNKIAQAGREYVIQNHDWQTVMDGFERDLESVRHTRERLPVREQSSLCTAV
jgi:sugar transferase (PEP-CTERM/EpsH1 system associated)